ncbi:MAG: hypothetical protein WDO74_06980 [Pseudomonadota bacterium]
MSALLLTQVASLLLSSLRAFLYALAALIAFRLLNGRISTHGLINDRETGGVSALRIQMLIATAIAGASYAAAIHRQTTSQFPPVDADLLALVSGSNGFVIVQSVFSKLSKFICSNR